MLNSWVYRLLKKMYLCMADRVYQQVNHRLFKLVTSDVKSWSFWQWFFHSLVTFVTSFHRMISDHWSHIVSCWSSYMENGQIGHIFWLVVLAPSCQRGVTYIVTLHWSHIARGGPRILSHWSRLAPGGARILSHWSHLATGGPCSLVTLVTSCHSHIGHLLEQSHSAASEATSCHPTAINTRNLWKFHNWMCMMIYHDVWGMKMKCQSGQSAQSSQCSQSGQNGQNGQKGESGVNWPTFIAASTRVSNSGQETWKLTAKGRMWSSWQSDQI